VGKRVDKGGEVITIDLRTNAAQIVGSLRNASKQTRFATAVALTRTAQAVQQKETLEIKDVFDRPTPFTVNSIYIKPATKSNLTAAAYIKDFAGKGIPASKYLKAEINGGFRRQKKFERALTLSGAMPPGYYAVPGEAADMDAFGNIKPSQIVQILSFFRAFPEAGYKANMNDKGRARLAKGSKRKGTLGFEYFAGAPGDGKLPLGIWKRTFLAHGQPIKPIIIFVKGAFYQKLFDFEYVARKTVEKEFPRLMSQAYQEAMRTAR
jgi:hypothetical protein